MTLLIGGLIGAAAGMLAGVLGLGGGIIIPPLLSVLLGLEQHAAQAASLAALLPPVGLPALLGYRRAGIAVHWRTVSWLIASFAGAGVLGGLVAQTLPERPLRWLFAAVLAALVIRTLVIAYAAKPERQPSDLVRRFGAWPAMAIGATGGLASGMFGIGGGVLILPLLTNWARFDRLTSQVTTLAMMLAPIGLPAVIVYALSGGLPWALLGSVAAGFTAGAFLGGRLAVKVPAHFAQLLFAAILVASAVSLVLKG